MEIVEHLQTIGYVLFHTRKDTDQHLFAIKGICSVKSADELEENRYKNVTTTAMYVIADLEVSTELDSSDIHSTNKAFTPNTRYDAQYVTIKSLKIR